MSPEAKRDGRSARVEREIFLRSLGMGGAGASGPSRQMAQTIRDTFFQAGSVIYEIGDAAEHFYFVVRGEVSQTAPDAAPWSLSDRSVVGLLDVIIERPRARRAHAVTDVHALMLRADDWFEVLEDNFDFCRRSVVMGAANLHQFTMTFEPSGGFAPAPPDDGALWAGREMNLIERITALRDVPAFGGAGIQPLTTLAGVAKVIRLDTGDELFDRNAAAGALFVVASGTIFAEREGPAIRARFGAGSLVCGYGALGNPEADYTARAESPTIALRIDHEDLFDVMEEHFDLSRSLLRGIAAERERLIRSRPSDQPREGRGGTPDEAR
jgi:CRP-like cAMP-binding protein